MQRGSVLNSQWIILAMRAASLCPVDLGIGSLVQELLHNTNLTILKVITHLATALHIFILCNLILCLP